MEINTFSCKKIHLTVSSAKRRPLCLGLNVSTIISTILQQRVCEIVTYDVHNCPRLQCIHLHKFLTEYGGYAFPPSVCATPMSQYGILTTADGKVR